MLLLPMSELPLLHGAGKQLQPQRAARHRRTAAALQLLLCILQPSHETLPRRRCRHGAPRRRRQEAAQLRCQVRQQLGQRAAYLGAQPLQLLHRRRDVRARKPVQRACVDLLQPLLVLCQC